MKKKSIITITILLLSLLFTTCEMEVTEKEAKVLLVEPYITKHPQSSAYTVGTTPTDLTVEVDEWIDGDGDLSYQWYTFSDIAAYLTSGAGQEITGATGDTYTPGAQGVTLNTAAGGKNYFYVVVTNTNNKATDKNNTEASVTSDVAILSFYAPGSPQPPIITRQPSGAQARFGRALNPLSVRATVPAGGTLSYQWYQVKRNAAGTGFETAAGVPVGNQLIARIEQVEKPEVQWGDPTVPEYDDVVVYETELEFTPTYTRASAGAFTGAFPNLQVEKNYFYVVVTHTDAANNTATETSVPALVNILFGLRADTPLITTQPNPALYFTSETPAALTVAGTSPDFGDLSYQWYVNTTTNTNKSGTILPGATNASYTPNLTANPNAYYFAEVTNTNVNVIGAQTASVRSRAVNVRSTAPATGVSEAYSIALKPSERYNYIRGYGGMEVAWANFPETYPAETERQYDPDQLGYNILRIMLPVTDTNIDKAMDYLVKETNRRPHYYENVKIVNKYGGFVAAAPWSMPKEWKSNNSINGGGYLQHQYYDQYAAYLKSYAQHMFNRGAPIYVISIQNEPNYTAGYDGCEWEPEEMRDFFKKVGTFTQGVRGWGGGKQTPRVLTMNGESANNPNINWPAIDDPLAYQHIDVFARHVYGERSQNLWSSRPAVQKTDGKEVWMTEHNINSANANGYYNDSKWNLIWRFMNDVDLVMRLNNENAFIWWASKRFYSMIGDGQYGTVEGNILPRGWGLSHYSKYTIDTTRIGFSMTRASDNEVIFENDARNVAFVNGSSNDMDNTSARITAYQSQDGNELSLVMWTPTTSNGDGGVNPGWIKIEMPPNFTIGSVTAIRSRYVNISTNEFHLPYDVQVANGRTAAYVQLNNNQIISVKFTKQ